MLDGGILKPLRDRSDWVCVRLTIHLTLLKSPSQLGVELAMQSVNDIPEAELIDILRDCISAQVAMREGDGSTMDVDHAPRPSRTPLSLDRMLSLLVGYPVSGPPFRVALRDILSNAEAITAVLKVLATWVKAWGEKGAMIRVDGATNERDLMKRASKVAKSEGNEGGLPRLDLVSFAFITSTYLPVAAKGFTHLVLPDRVVPYSPTRLLLGFTFAISTRPRPSSATHRRPRTPNILPGGARCVAWAP